MGVLVNEYAWTRTLLLAALSSRTTASVQPPFGEKKTWMGGLVGGGDVSCARQVRLTTSRKMKAIAVRLTWTSVMGRTLLGKALARRRKRL